MSNLRPLADTDQQFQELRQQRKIATRMRQRWHQVDHKTRFHALASEALAWDNMMRHAHCIAADAQARRDDCLRRLDELKQQGGEP